MCEQLNSLFFKIHYKCEFGFSVYVLLANADESWLNLKNAIRLDWNEVCLFKIK